MSAQGWVQASLIYFSLLLIFIGIAQAAGVFIDITTINPIIPVSASDVNSSSSTVPTKLSSGSSYFKTVFSLFVWNVNITNSTIAPYVTYIRIIFCWLPLIFLGLALWYSTALSSGGD